jgi:hypothetical protein
MRMRPHADRHPFRRSVITTAAEAAPIACSLAPGAYRDGIAWILELTTRFLRDHRRDGLTLHLVYDGEAAAQVRELVRREQACCGFLTFSLQETTDTVHLTIIAPVGVEAAVAFQQFVPVPGSD